MIASLRRYSARSLVVCMVLLLTQRPYPGQLAGSEGDSTDSLFLLRNILKDIGKEGKVDEQYKLFLRADSIYKDIKESLSDTEAKSLRKQLSAVFHRLPSPEDVLTLEGLRLSLKEGDHEAFYWSDSITEKMFIDYLNAVELHISDLSKHLTPASHTIVFNEEVSKYTSRNPDHALAGINFLIANEFTKWLSQKTKYRFSLPSEYMVLASGEARPSCWTRTIWKEKDSIRSDAWEMFGAKFYTFFINGSRSGELPESCYAEIHLRVVTTATTGKRLYLRTLRSEI